MRNFAVIAVGATLVLAGCSGSSEQEEGVTTPGPSIVGSVTIETHAPEVAEPGATATPEASPSPWPSEAPLDFHPDDATDEQIQAALDLLCGAAAEWWRSSTTLTLEEWRANGTGVYASTYTLDSYTDPMFASLKSEDWREFDTEAFAIPQYESGACLFSRPESETKHVEVLTLTFTAVPDTASPGVLLYDDDISLRAARERAQDSILR